MPLKYPKFVVWKKEISNIDVMDNFSPRQKKYINSLLNSPNFSTIQYKIEKINTDFLEKFTPFYNQKIQHKRNPHIVDIELLISEKSKEFPIYCLSILEEGVFVGGSIFIHRLNRMTTSVKSFESNWLNFRSSTSPTLLAEYFFYKHAISFGYTLITHGKDRNPYGQNSSINLCATKLQLGYSPYLPKGVEYGLLELKDIKEDILLLTKPTMGEIITEGLLVLINNADEQNYNLLLNTKSKLRITIEHLNNNAELLQQS